MTSYPSTEVIKAICTCGNEIGFLQYKLTAKNDFSKFLKNFKSKFDPEDGNFEDPDEYIGNLKLCCIIKLRAGNIISLGINQTTNNNRVYPTTLTGPIRKDQTLMWYV